jgi:hypothetical protein
MERALFGSSQDRLVPFRRTYRCICRHFKITKEEAALIDREDQRGGEERLAALELAVVSRVAIQGHEKD